MNKILQYPNKCNTIFQSSNIVLPTYPFLSLKCVGVYAVRVVKILVIIQCSTAAAIIINLRYCSYNRTGLLIYANILL